MSKFHQTAAIILLPLPLAFYMYGIILKKMLLLQSLSFCCEPMHVL